MALARSALATCEEFSFIGYSHGKLVSDGHSLPRMPKLAMQGRRTHVLSVLTI